LIKGIASSYPAVYSLVRGELKSKLKIPRPRSISQKSTAINEFKPTFRRCGWDSFISCEIWEPKRFWVEVMRF